MYTVWHVLEMMSIDPKHAHTRINTCHTCIHIRSQYYLHSRCDMYTLWRVLEMLSIAPWGITELELRSMVGGGQDGLLPQIQTREVYMCMYVCVCVCVYTYIYIYIYTYMHVCIAPWGIRELELRSMVGGGQDGLLPQI